MSVTQVSRALNDHDDVAESTKELARRVAAELRYAPNLDARRLRDPAARTSTLGIVLPTDSLRFSDPFFGELLSAMVVEAAAHDLQLSLTTPLAGTPAITPYDRAIRHKLVDGFVILRTLVNDERIDFLRDKSFPFVAFGRPGGQDGFAAVEAVPDSFEPAVAHLVGLGHQRVACLAEPSQFAISTARLQSFRSAIANSGIALCEHDVVEAGFHERSGYEATMTLLDSANPPGAIVAMNDLLALGALQAAAARQLRVPEDLTVIGFDDIPAASQVTPSLTTLRQPAAEVGSSLIQELLAAIDSGGVAHQSRWVTPSLVVRASSGPLTPRK